jgi:hypothetical protein
LIDSTHGKSEINPARANPSNNPLMVQGRDGGGVGGEEEAARVPTENQALIEQKQTVAII